MPLSNINQISFGIQLNSLWLGKVLLGVEDIDLDHVGKSKF